MTRTRDVYADGDRVYVLGPDGERVYGVCLLPADEPVAVDKETIRGLVYRGATGVAVVE